MNYFAYLHIPEFFTDTYQKKVIHRGLRRRGAFRCSETGKRTPGPSEREMA